MKSVLLLDHSVRITELEIPRRDVADFLRTVDENEVDSTLIQAIEVGVFCLERARVTHDTEFVRRQLDQLERYYEREGRLDAVRNLGRVLDQAAALIERDPGFGLPAPGPTRGWRVQDMPGAK